MYRKKGNRNLSEIAEFLIDSFEFLLIGGKLAFYTPPNWTILTSNSAKRQVLLLIEDSCKEIGSYLLSGQLEELVKKISLSPRVKALPEIPYPDHHQLCCKDGIYCWPDHSIFPLRSKDLRFSHLEVFARDIAPRKTPIFDRFLDTVAQDDCNLRQRILEVIGVILTGIPCKNFFVFEGVSDSGKSQLSRFLQDVLGDTACFAINGVNQLGNRWTSGMLPGKLLCVCSDVPDKPLDSDTVGAIKQLTGDDPIYGEIKFQSPFVFKNTAKLLFLTNFSLRITGNAQDPALLKRMVCIPFRHAVPESQQIPNLHELLLNEAGGIIWKALQAAEEFEDQNYIFTPLDCDTDDNVLILVPSVVDQIRNFVTSCCELDSAAYTVTAELHRAFLRFIEADNSSSQKIKSNDFGRKLQSLGFPILPDRIGGARVYRGIKLRSDKNISYSGGESNEIP